MTESDVTDSSVTAKSLIDSKVCPPWWVPSQPLMGRCVPFFSQDGDGGEMSEESVLVEDADTPTGESVTGKILLQAVEKVA